MSREHNKPFVLGQTEWYRVVSVPSGDPRFPTFKLEMKSTSLMGETIWVQPSDMTRTTYTTVVSSVLHHLYAEANRK